MRQLLITIVSILCGLNSATAQSEPSGDIAKIIASADRARGLSPLTLSYSFEVEMFSEGTSSNLKKYNLASRGTSAEATLIFPQKTYNEAVVVQGTMVWIAKENSRRPTMVSLNERMTGSASVGDIMAMYFSENFKIESSEDVEKSKQIKKVTLKATAPLVAYEKVVIWLDMKAKLVREAEYLSANVESVKHVNFTYDHQYPGSDPKEKTPFISKMVFKENSENTAIVNYGLPKIVKLPDNYFELENVVEHLQVIKK